MTAATYRQRRSEIEHYFDRTAAEAWSKLTSNAPVGRVRQTVRAGREEMRNTLLSWLPKDLSGHRILDAGCGTGVLAVEAAQRGAEVVAVDLSPTLVDLARERVPDDLRDGRLDFRVGDMWDPDYGQFDHVVAMDSLIRYNPQDAVRMISGLASVASTSMLFTFAPSTRLLSIMHAAGRWFPRGDRAPSIQPVCEQHLDQLLSSESGLTMWKRGRSQRISSGFYTSQAYEVTRL